MTRGRYRSFINSVFDDMAYGFDYFNPSRSYPFRGEIVDTENFDIVPKKHYREQQLKLKEQRLQELKERKENDIRLYDEQEKALKLEIDELRQKLSP